MRHFDRDDLIGEVAGSESRGIASLALQREFVLRRARDAVLRGEALGRGRHVAVVEGVPEAIVEHGVELPGVAQPRAPPRVRQHVGHLAHALHTASQGDFRLTEADRLCGQGDGL